MALHFNINKSMKKIITLLITALTLSLTANAQLVVSSETNYNESDIVSLVGGRLVIRNTADGLYLCLNTNNQFEENYATLLLGKNKESALKTLDDLLSLPVEKGKLINSYGMNGAATSIEKVTSLGDKQIILRTDGVAGEGIASTLYLKKAKDKLAKASIE